MIHQSCALRANWVVDFQPGELVVGLILAMGNDSAATFVGQPVAGVDQPVTTQFLLPEGATDVQFQGGVLGGVFKQWISMFMIWPRLRLVQVPNSFFSAIACPMRVSKLSLPRNFCTPLTS
ncbi:MAG: hypothetical protein R2911_04405 [Caldilineaceae bacterium]